MTKKATYRQLEERVRELEAKLASDQETLLKSQECERRFSVIIRTVPDIIYRLDPYGRITFVNDAVRNYGYEPDRLIGRDILDLVEPGFREEAKYRLAERRTGERKTSAFEISLKAANGKAKEFEVKSGIIDDAPVFLIDAEGIYANGVPGKCTFLGTQGVARDITERRQTERELRRNEAWLASVFRASPAGIGVVANRQLKFANETLCQMLGYHQDELLGQNTRMLYLSGQEYERIGMLLHARIHEDAKGEVSTKWKRKDGGVLDILLNTSPLNPDNVKEGVTFTALDITETRKVEEQLRHSQKMEAIGRLAGGIAHDFNNLLMVVSGNAEMLKIKLDNVDNVDSHLNQITNASDRASNLTKQLLAFSRKQVMDCQMLDLNLVIRGLANMLKPIIGEDIEFKMELGDGLGKVRADAGQIEQVVMNLVVNARDAMPRGGKLTISTAHRKLGHDMRNMGELATGTYVCLSVSDTGEGIDRKIQSKIFDPFFTTKKSGMGSGLGLSTVYGTVKQSGGDIILRSEAGKGTSFTIYLPEVQSADESERIKPVNSGKIHRGSETLLVVEDEQMVLGLAERILVHAGYKVIPASNPDKALEIFKEKHQEIDLVITDVIMPRFSGKELADRLMAIKPDTRVLFMSGYTNNAIAQHGILAEGTHFIPKPFRSGELTGKIREVLDLPA